MPVSVSRNATAVNSPYAVGRRTDVIRSTSRSVRLRYSIRSATVIIFRPWRSQYGIRSGTRAIVPSSFITSQTTPAGVQAGQAGEVDRGLGLAGALQHAAPAARSGKTWPGWTRSWALVGSIATWIVRQRSGAEMPVVTPSRASIETVNAVPSGDSLLLGHRPQAELVAALLRQAEADQAARLAWP